MYDYIERVTLIANSYLLLTSLIHINCMNSFPSLCVNWHQINSNCKCAKEIGSSGSDIITDWSPEGQRCGEIEGSAGDELANCLIKAKVTAEICLIVMSVM